MKFKTCARFSTSSIERSRVRSTHGTCIRSWVVCSAIPPKLTTSFPEWDRVRTPRSLSRSLWTSCSRLKQTSPRRAASPGQRKQLKQCSKLNKCSSRPSPSNAISPKAVEASSTSQPIPKFSTSSASLKNTGASAKTRVITARRARPGQNSMNCLRRKLPVSVTTSERLRSRSYLTLRQRRKPSSSSFHRPGTTT